MKKIFTEVMRDVIGENFAFEPFFVREDGAVAAEAIEVIDGSGTWQINVRYPIKSIRDTLYLKKEPEGLTCRRIFETAEDLNLCELGINLKGISFGKDLKDDYFYHVENPRIYERMTFPVDYDRVHSGDAKDSEFDETAGNRWADPGVVCERIGRSPYQPFPAVLFSNYNTEKGLVHGTLSQKVFFHNYIAKHEDDALTLEIYSGFKAVDALQCKAGKRLIDEWYIGTTAEADDFDRLFANYTAVLRRKLPVMYGASDINRKTLIWGTWNDGVCRNFSEAMILNEARYLKENFPQVSWIQVDAGYALRDITVFHGIGMPYEGPSGVDPKKFPDGLRAYTDKIKQLGLRPAVWIGGFCPLDCPLFIEKPQWFVDYSYRLKSSAVLDVSQQEVRDYMTSALDTFFYEYGFEGVKHDFWSYAFEDSKELYADKSVSGYEMRHWWCSEMRKHLPYDGYMQSCCDISMGNPFHGEYFTNYRYGIDIASGNWDCVKTTFLWGMACFGTHTGDLFVPNSDSVGLFPGLNDNEAMFCLNYCLVTRSTVEIAGRLSGAGDSPRLKRLKKAVCNPNNGQDVYTADYDYRCNAEPRTKIFYLKTPHFSCEENNKLLPLRTVGLFNVRDEVQKISFTPASLGLENGNYLLLNVWTNETFALSDKAEFELPPHGSMLLAAADADNVLILDANMRINSAADDKVVFDYKGDAELLLAREVSKVRWNSEDIPFVSSEYNKNHLVSFKVPAAGTVELIF